MLWVATFPDDVSVVVYFDGEVLEWEVSGAEPERSRVLWQLAYYAEFGWPRPDGVAPMAAIEPGWEPEWITTRLYASGASVVIPPPEYPTPPVNNELVE